MEYNIQKYQFHQNGKDYIVSTGLVGNRIRITCQENFLDGPFYSNEFSLYDLRVANQFFLLTQTPEEALNEINKGIERQKSGLKKGINDTIQFFGYLVIGTDNDVYNLILKRDYEPNKYGIFTPPRSSAADLVLTTNYKVDGERLKEAEKIMCNLQRDQTFIEEELKGTIPEINKLKKISIDIEEENALIKERLTILQKQLEQRKYNVIKLKKENENLKRENDNLDKYIKNKENSIRNKQIIQTNVKINERPNINPGISAVTSKFEQSVLRTFVPRTEAKPTTEEYNKNLNYITTILPQYAQSNNIYGNNYVQTIYQEPQIVVQQPVMYKLEQPIEDNGSYKKLRNSNYSNISSNFSYKNPTYRAYLSGLGSKEVIYNNRVIGLNKNNIQMINQKNNELYNSPLNQNKIIPIDIKMNRSNSNNDIYYNNQKENNLKLIGNNKKIGNVPSSNISNNIGYNSLMGNPQSNAKAQYNKPIGSRLPKENLDNIIDKSFQKKVPKTTYNSKTQGNDSPVIGYSSYKPDEK